MTNINGLALQKRVAIFDSESFMFQNTFRFVKRNCMIQC